MNFILTKLSKKISLILSVALIWFKSVILWKDELYFFLYIKKWLCIKTGIRERGKECGEREEWRECYIRGNVAKHSGECPQTFRGMSSNIPGNVAKHSRECPQTFRGMSPNIPRNIAKHSGEYRLTFRGTFFKHSSSSE